MIPLASSASNGKKFWILGESLQCVFFQSYEKCFISEINVSFWSNLIQSCLYVCSTS